MSPITSLLQSFSTGSNFHIARSLAGSLYLQLHALKWPQPDYITPFPLSFFSSLENPYNPSELLAKHLADYTGAPIVHPIKRHFCEYLHNDLARKERLELSYDIFREKKRFCLQDKTILIVQDLFITNGLVDQMAHVLRAYGPKKIFVLALTSGT